MKDMFVKSHFHEIFGKRIVKSKFRDINAFCAKLHCLLCFHELF